ncbi:hypothetical protein EV426DRAFT_707424 [Tirmania nivea]|nr:hypothetical protein EV426DRAFT_707424 [Tirmania nivea]
MPTPSLAAELANAWPLELGNIYDLISDSAIQPLALTITAMSSNNQLDKMSSNNQLDTMSLNNQLDKMSLNSQLDPSRFTKDDWIPTIQAWERTIDETKSDLLELRAALVEVEVKQKELLSEIQEHEKAIKEMESLAQIAREARENALKMVREQEAGPRLQAR